MKQRWILHTPRGDELPTGIPAFSIFQRGGGEAWKAREARKPGPAVAGRPGAPQRGAEKLEFAEPEAPSSKASRSWRGGWGGRSGVRPATCRSSARRSPRPPEPSGRRRRRPVGPVLEPTDNPSDDHREERQDAGHRQADGPHGGGRPCRRGRARGRPAAGGSPAASTAVVVDEDEAGEEQHHHGEEGEDHAHAAGGNLGAEQYLFFLQKHCFLSLKETRRHRFSQVVPMSRR
ncbi:PREDICTED: uncharacterized protein LOC109396190 isoform X2 [Hipposideros armiger]|uniref:Uncharacterized protein LOC109396190 isoform X2 n=1 Tax=Hipposideros armiger TaxID=186990 RepID=A0A8B7TF44_HIPAR|nr:PREDICTED: uncharacterized protein LOC109396190 isoform X2 [Hipposideros armiger]